MDTFRLSNHVHVSTHHALLLLYRYLTGIYTLGDLSLVQFLGGYLRGERRGLQEGHVLTVSGNGIGELEKLLSLQWRIGQLDTMAVSPRHMQIMRLLADASPDEVAGFFKWTRQTLSNYPNLQALLDSPGLVDYWQQQVELWQSPRLKGKVKLFSGSPWDIPTTQRYDAIILSHAQRLLRDHPAEALLSYLEPGGIMVVLTPVIFRPESLAQKMPPRFSDSPPMQEAKEKVRAEARRLGYTLLDGHPAHINWPLTRETTSHVVFFSIASPLRSLLIGELLIQSLNAELQESIRLSLLEAALTEVSPSEGAGTEALLILITEKGS